MIEDGEPAFMFMSKATPAGGGWAFCERCGSPLLMRIMKLSAMKKTFDEKVKGRIRLMEETGYVTEPIWLLTRGGVQEILEKVAAEETPLYDFTSDFSGESELCGITNRIFKVRGGFTRGRELKELVKAGPLYIADGHHRYHSALRMGPEKNVSLTSARPTRPASRRITGSSAAGSHARRLGISCP